MRENNLAPIVLFAFNRQWHTQQTIKALRNNELAADSELFVFSDGPRFKSDMNKVQSVRQYLKTISGFKKVTIIERTDNLGLGKSIITGVTDIVDKYGSIIVLEDDMITSLHFLKFMNEALAFYKNEDRVISVHGYIYPVNSNLPQTFFLKGADCWGWATWKRGWDLFEADGQKLLDELRARKLTREFDFNGSIGYTRMLENQVSGRNNSWAIRWYASAFLKNKLTLYPGRPLVRNIGMDASGTNCIPTEVFDGVLTEGPIRIEQIPLEENITAKIAVEHFLKHSESLSLSKLVAFGATKLKRIFR